MVTKLETQGKQIFQWGEKFVDIATLEKAVYEAVLSLGRNIMRQCIEEADRTLARQRDRGMYRDKGYRPTTLKTVMGEVGYQRHVYLLSGAAEQPRATVYLLDRSMGLDTVGPFSDTVCMMAVEAACAVSHRTAAATLNDLTGLSLSHESVWRIVQNAGSWEQARVDSLAAAAKAECGSGTYETPVLYEEMDGVYLALQGKDRLEHGPSKEMKVSIAYSGIYEDASGRRSLANKVSYASMEQAEHFRRHAEGVVADFYAVDCVKRRVFNSDGGTWLQRNMVPGCTYQLDLFHRNRAVRTCVNDPDLQETILELFHARKVKEAIAVVEASIGSRRTREAAEAVYLLQQLPEIPYSILPTEWKKTPAAQRGPAARPVWEHGEQHLYHYWEPDEAQPHLLERGRGQQPCGFARLAPHRPSAACSAGLDGPRGPL